MTPDELTLVTESAAVAFADPDCLAHSLSDHLYAVAAPTASLFANGTEGQRAELVAELGRVVAAATDLDSFVAQARGLGRRHARYGVEPGDYEHGRVALLAALADALGPDWTSAHVAAWSKLYRLLAETMLDGAAAGMFSAR
jgi:hemoglobin-like flavoprotein